MGTDDENQNDSGNHEEIVVPDRGMPVSFRADYRQPGNNHSVNTIGKAGIRLSQERFEKQLQIPPSHRTE